MILYALNRHAIEYPSSKLSNETFFMYERCNWLPETLDRSSNFIVVEPLNPLHFTNLSMQTKFALPSNPSHVFVEKQPSSSQQSPSSELSSDSPPLLEWLSRLCPSTLFMYMSFPKLGLLKGKPLYLLTTRFASKTNAAVNGSKAQPQLFHWNPQLELLSTKNQPCVTETVKGGPIMNLCRLCWMQLHNCWKSITVQQCGPWEGRAMSEESDKKGSRSRLSWKLTISPRNVVHTSSMFLNSSQGDLASLIKGHDTWHLDSCWIFSNLQMLDQLVKRS
jgi:hypothetical protein